MQPKRLAFIGRLKAGEIRETAMDELKSHVKDFLERLRRARCAVVLTGAGVSTDSGIRDFRSPSGLYSKVSQRTFEIDFFRESPAEYYRIALEHIHTLADKAPNATHQLLAELEARKLIRAVITQNIDGLHQKAGSENVIEFHGDVTRFFCTRCDKPFDRERVDTQICEKGKPTCDACGALIRPGIVFFGDPIPMEALYDSQSLVQHADFFIAMGTSLAVNPAAGLAAAAANTGADLCIINRGPTHLDDWADLRIETDLKTFSQSVLALLEPK